VAPEFNTHAGEGARPTLRVVLIAAQPQRGEIAAALAAVTEPMLEIREADPGSPVSDDADLVMFVFDREHKEQPGHAAAGEHGAAVRIALMHERSSYAIREAIRAGADEVLFLPLEQGELARALVKISESRKPLEPAGRGRLLSLISVTGGAGVTTTAAHCALALAHTMGKKVALVDLDFQSGDLAVALNVEAEQTILDLTKPDARLNSVQIESVLCKHPSGVYLLAAPKRIEESEQVTAARVGLVVDLMRQMVDVVIVDCGRHINDSSVVVWEKSDEVLYVIDQSIAAMRAAWRFTDLFGRLKVPLQPRFVLNRWVPRHPIGEKHIVNTLGRPLAGRIPRDDEAMARIAARGDDLWKIAPRSALARGYEALVHALAGFEHGHHKRGGLFSKFFARNGARPRSKT
jgi:pilus assembly protein CpaE